VLGAWSWVLIGDRAGIELWGSIIQLARAVQSKGGDQGLDMMDLVEGIALDMEVGQASE
jgi:hypothetical protein